jgi:hypothetical protein
MSVDVKGPLGGTPSPPTDEPFGHGLLDGYKDDGPCCEYHELVASHVEAADHGVGAEVFGA